MKNLLPLAAACFSLVVTILAQAGTETSDQSTATAEQAAAVPLDIFKFESGYDFESDLNHGGSRGQQDEIQNEIEYGHRIQITGNYYLHLGLSYDRYDFGSTNSPVPNHLQAAAAVLGIDYMHGADVGAFLEIRPGFYFQNDVGSSSFDVPISVARIFVLREDQLYLFAGVHAAFLHGNLPVVPLLGVIWIPNDKLRLMALPPDPRLIYSPTKKLDLWIGGEFVGGSFRTDQNDNLQPVKLRGAQIDFTDYRVGVGLSYELTSQILLDLGAGCSIEREFHFARAGETYRTDPSPYIRLQLTAPF